ncbi:hypothetical protein CEUSTIGMA_g5741.t1 [Chlamydomonas eustigma]|uniref:EF-hand domain-containing protein n=1 Tax=Chlamydomonas eustigma TaxID=1157962 RepID=A0A250X5W0_9CHLO|nr:hypothetical protein CEUSTIGMA_g5741.t1 [Chlamydomonas eustigma]|eukprot:GAX78299.1 hypothetical protein CEUSTIGMA_g5741.t1 [Chlamydomonas eustigma]
MQTPGESHDSLFDDIKDESANMKPPVNNDTTSAQVKAPMEDSAKDNAGRPDPRKMPVEQDEKHFVYDEADVDELLAENEPHGAEIDHGASEPAVGKPPPLEETTAVHPKQQDELTSTAIAQNSSTPDAPLQQPDNVVITPSKSKKHVMIAADPVVNSSSEQPSATTPDISKGSKEDMDQSLLHTSDIPSFDKSSLKLAPSMSTLPSEFANKDINEQVDQAIKKPTPLPELLPSESVDFHNMGASAAKMNPGGVTVDISEGAPDKTVDRAAAAARFKAMEERHKPHHDSKPVMPMVTEEEVEKAHLSSVDKRSGLELPTPLDLFLKYDEDKTGGINRNEFGQMLFDLDSLESVPKKKRDEYIMREFAKADINSDDIISIDEFYLYFYSTLCFKFPVLRTGVNPGADLLNIYMKYCSVGKNIRCEELGSHAFTKLCVDSKLVNGGTVTRATCDIAWHRARVETESLDAWKRKNFEFITPKMLYPQFLFALNNLAAKRKSGFQEVVSKILANISSLPMPTNADYLILTNRGTEDQLEEFLERPRGLPRQARDTSAITSNMIREAQMAKSLNKPPKPKVHGSLESSIAAARDLITQAASGGDSSGAGPAGSSAAASFLTKDGPPADESTSSTPELSSSSNPALLRIKSSVKLEDSLRASGVSLPPGYGSGGRAPPDLPGPKAVLPDYNAPLIGKETIKKWGLDEKEMDIPKRGPTALKHPESILAAREMNPDDLMRGLKTTFEKYNQWEQGTNKGLMDKIRFAKCMRDAGLMCEQPGKMGSAEVDHIFLKVLPPASSGINFVRFVDALRHVATKLRISLNQVMDNIVLIGKPIISS